MARINMIQKHETVTAQKAFADFLQSCKMKNLAQKTVKTMIQRSRSSWTFTVWTMLHLSHRK